MHARAVIVLEAKGYSGEGGHGARYSNGRARIGQRRDVREYTARRLHQGIALFSGGRVVRHLTLGQSDAANVVARCESDMRGALLNPPDDHLGASTADVEYRQIFPRVDRDPTHGSAKCEAGFLLTAKHTGFDSEQRAAMLAHFPPALRVTHGAGPDDGNALRPELPHITRIVFQTFARARHGSR